LNILYFLRLYRRRNGGSEAADISFWEKTKVIAEAILRARKICGYASDEEIIRATEKLLQKEGWVITEGVRRAIRRRVEEEPLV